MEQAIHEMTLLLREKYFSDRALYSDEEIRSVATDIVDLFVNPPHTTDGAIAALLKMYMLGRLHEVARQT